MVDLDPPFPISLPALRHWDRLATEIHGQGRWELVSKDLLANFCQLLHLAQEVYGVEVRLSTDVTAGDAFFVDTTKLGYLVIREAMNIITGTNADDLARNQNTWIAELREVRRGCELARRST